MIATDKVKGSQKIVHSLSCGHTLHIEIRSKAKLHPTYFQTLAKNFYFTLCPICGEMANVIAAKKE